MGRCMRTYIESRQLLRLVSTSINFTLSISLPIYVERAAWLCDPIVRIVKETGPPQ